MKFASLKQTANGFLEKYKDKDPATFAAAEQAIGGLLILDGFIGIDNPFGGKKRSGIFGSLIGIILGILLIFGSSFLGNLFGVNKLTATTTATVITAGQPQVSTNNGNSSSSCTPQASYTVGGKEYTQVARMGSSSACSLTAGQKITINYDPSNPGSWAYDLATVKTVMKFFPIAGIIIALGSLVTFVIRLLSIIFGWKLLKSGRALAKTLPEGTDLGDMISRIRKDFSGHVFNPLGAVMGTSEPAAPTSSIDQQQL